MATDACTPPNVSTPGSIFDDEWSSFAGDAPNEYENLDHLDLDDILGPVPKASEAERTIDPQVLSHPQASPGSLDVGRFIQGLVPRNDEDNIVVGAARNPEPFDHQVATPPPTFHHSIEEPQEFDFGHYIPSPLKNQLNHRRSVSEPPAALPVNDVNAYGIPAPPQPAVTFTRSGTPLGTPKVHHGTQIIRNRHPHVQEPYPTRPAPPGRAWTQKRYHLRRSHTQPSQPARRVYAPTSMPAAMHQVHHPPPPATMMQSKQSQMRGPMQAGGLAVTSRVCTPGPSPPGMQSNPAYLDPRLHGAGHEEKQGLTIPLTIEELRGMITDAVKTALSSAGIRATIEGADGLEAEAAME